MTGWRDDLDDLMGRFWDVIEAISVPPGVVNSLLAAVRFRMGDRSAWALIGMLSLTPGALDFAAPWRPPYPRLPQAAGDVFPDTRLPQAGEARHGRWTGQGHGRYYTGSELLWRALLGVAERPGARGHVA